jgi:iron complex outermembrane receptor protein
VRFPILSIASVIVLAAPAPALAQRAGENAATQSGDAFGRSVGNDKTGLYSSDDVRGFNPVDAGNVRLEGLYFDQVDRISTRLVDGNTIRVGAASLRYPFPAPTGLVDYRLTQPGHEPSYSFALEEGSSGTRGIGGSFEFKQPLAGSQLGLSGGAGFRNARQFEGGRAQFRTSGLTLAYRPAPETEVLLFGGFFLFRGDEARPTFFPAGTLPPPQVQRGQDLSLSWSNREQTNWTYGGIVKAPLGPVRLEAGLFRNTRKQDRVFADLLLGVTQDGTAASRVVVADGNNFDASTSGELRLVRQWQLGGADQRLVASLRGRSRDRQFGGSRTLRLGPASLLTRDLRAEPAYVLGAENIDQVRQLTYGLAWSMVRSGAFSLDASLSQTRYRKHVDFADPLAPDPRTRENPLLWNVAGLVQVAPRLALYGGYSKGQEEALIAPDVATNRAEAPPAIRTSQLEGGARLALSDHLTLIAGGFSITKPYYNLDPAQRYRQLGELTNRGVELSLTGQIVPGFTVVGGTLFLDPRIHGEAVETRLIGPRPVGQIRRRSTVNFDFRPAEGKSHWSFDLGIDSLSERIGNAANTLTAPPRESVNLGLRYRFKLAGGDWLVRAQVINLLNDYGWSVSSSGGFTYSPQRTGILQLVADL